MIDGTTPWEGQVPATDFGGDERPPHTPSRSAPATAFTPSALLAPRVFGPFRPDIPEVERVAGLRGLEVGIAVFCGSGHAAIDALRRAKVDIAASNQALAEFDRLAALPKRKIISIYASVVDPRRPR